MGDRADVGAFADEPGTEGVAGDVVVLVVGEGMDFVGAGLDGGLFGVERGVGSKGFDDADLIEDELVGSALGELSFAKEDADLGCGALDVVGVDLDDDGDVVGSAAFIDDVFEIGAVAADAGTFVDGALDGVFGDAFLLGLFDGGEEASVHGGVGTTGLGGECDFAHEFAVGLALFQAGDEPFCVEPLSSHRRMSVATGRRGGNAAGWGVYNEERRGEKRERGPVVALEGSE